MQELIFEYVGDINFKHPYLCVYFNGDINPFMDVGVSETGGVQFLIYGKVTLSAEQWKEILEEGYKFLPRALSVGDDVI